MDIDKRAYQLAYFALFMKARQYNRRIFDGTVAPQVYHPAGLPESEEYGSLLKIDDPGEKPKEQTGQFTLMDESHESEMKKWNFKRLLAQKYDVVVTNPPYMGNGGMNGRLAQYVKDYYPDSKSDLFAVFIEKCCDLTKYNCYTAMITQHSWMFLSSYEKLREKLMAHDTINMAHLGPRAFAEIGGEVVQSTAFVMRGGHIGSYKGGYMRLVDINDADEKERVFLSGEHSYTASTDNFTKIPGSPVTYWVGDAILNVYKTSKLLSELAIVKTGIQTGDNPLFVRFWHEIGLNKMGLNHTSADMISKHGMKWFPYNKGGEYRKWYGNVVHVVDMENDGRGIKNHPKNNYRLRERSFYFREAITWSFVTSGNFSVRFLPAGCLYDVAGSCFYVFDENIKNYILGFLSSKIANTVASIQNPTINMQIENIEQLPIIINDSQINESDDTVDKCIELSKIDWDAFEISWDFKQHPMVHGIFKLSLENALSEKYIEASFQQWQRECDERFNTLKTNEEELNRIFIDIYGLQDELTPEVEDKDVTVRRADLGREIRSLISYAVGCMFGRYSLDTEGLAYAGGDWDTGKYSSFIPDRDNIIPITDEEYLPGDIVTRFVDFIRTVYGADALEENLRFIADALGGRGSTAREVIRGYFIKGFYADHVKTYQKRPIYWLFDSGKADGFKALIYLHRYNQDTVGKLRIDYLHKLQRVYENEINRMRETIEKSGDAREVSAATKRLEKLIKQLKEAKEYDEKIAHLALARIALNLDDGVKVNYEKLQTDADGKRHEVLGKI